MKHGCLSWAGALAAGWVVGTSALAGEPVTIRVATFNVGGVTTAELMTPESERVKRLSEVIQRVRPNVILISEIAYDVPGVGGAPSAGEAGRNGERFAEFLAAPQGPGLEGLKYKAFMAPVNSGMASGLDLNRDGKVVTEYPPPLSVKTPTSPPPGPGERAYSGDCWGAGEYPGQRGMALLVDERLTIRADRARTFRLLPWDYMPGAFIPPAKGAVDGGEGHGSQSRPVAPEGKWYTDEEIKVARLSSSGHWDVPVELPGGAVVHFLCSNPVMPLVDGPEMRSARRNHDEVRFWADYVQGEQWIVDDRNETGGLDGRELFVIVGDLNADGDEGVSFKNPIGNVLLASRRVNAKATPVSDVAVEGMSGDDTCTLGWRLDYVLPCREMEVGASGVWRHAPNSAGGAEFPSDHWPVWMELRVPGVAP